MGIENAEVKWDDLMADYNAVKNTNFTIPSEMLLHVYTEKRTYAKTGKVFLLSTQTISKYFHKWNLKCFPSGHRGDSNCLKAIRKMGDVSRLTAKQIAKEIDYSCARVGAVLGESRIPYKKLRK
jgi:hypothetical protein